MDVHRRRAPEHRAARGRQPRLRRLLAGSALRPQRVDGRHVIFDERRRSDRRAGRGERLAATDRARCGERHVDRVCGRDADRVPKLGRINSAPANLAAPTVDGNAEENDVLAADVGIWSKVPSSYAYQWQRCDGAGAACANVAGATGATIALGHDYVGSTFRVAVVGTNASGSSQAVASAATAPVTASVPVNQTPPAIDGVAQEGELLVADPGTWSGTPDRLRVPVEALFWVTDAVVLRHRGRDGRCVPRGFRRCR